MLGRCLGLFLLLIALPALADVRLIIGGHLDEVDVERRHVPLATYLESRLHQPVTIRFVSNGAAAAQALTEGEGDLSVFGPMQYAASWLRSGGAVEPLVTNIEDDGSLGYYAVLVVRSDSAFYTLDDLAGGVIATSTQTSTSGYVIPRAALRASGRNPDSFFSALKFVGAGEKAVLTLVEGHADGALAWISGNENGAGGRTRGPMRALVDTGRLKMSDVRIVWRSAMIPNGPWTVRTALDPGLKAAIRQALLDLPRDQPDAFAVVSFGPGKLTPVDHSFYAGMIEMARAENAAR